MPKILLLASILFLICTTASAEADTDWKKNGKLSHLSPLIGTYSYDEVLNDPYVRSELKAMMGDELFHLEKNLNVRSPIGLITDCLILTGNLPHQGNKENAYLNVCMYKGQIDAAIRSEGKIFIYTKAAEYDSIPLMLKVWVNRLLNPDFSKNKPDIVDIVNSHE